MELILSRMTLKDYQGYKPNYNLPIGWVLRGLFFFGQP